jgi:1-acyl-sn-glycerol-3-phosphate acyltransferase
VRLLRISWRGTELALHLAFGALALPVLRHLPAARAESLTRWWYGRACRVLRLRVRRRGSPTPMPALYAANHVSWLEVLALGSAVPMAFVAKSEVSRWPLIGSLAGAAGALFLRRGSARAAAGAVDQAVLRLAGGTSVCVFPEGTSTAGGDVRPFKASLFEAAARLGCEVQPVAVSYPAARGGAVAPFIGDDEFLAHLLRVLAEKEIVVELSFTTPLQGHGRSRSELSSAARQAASEALAGTRAEAALQPAEPPDAVPTAWWDSSAYGDFMRVEFRPRIRPRDFASACDERVTLRHPRGVDSPGAYLVPCVDAQ